MSTALKLIVLHWVLQSPRDTRAKIELTIEIYSSENRLQERSEKNGKIAWVQEIANNFWTVMSTARKLILLHWVLQSPRNTRAKIELTIKI